MLASAGITSPLITSSRGVHWVDDVTRQFGALNTERQMQLRETFVAWTDAVSLISLRPFCALLIALALVLLLKMTKQPCKEEIILIFAAVGYYSSFLINTQAHEFRYYAPSFYILLVVIICASVKMIWHAAGEWKVGSRNTV